MNLFKYNVQHFYDYLFYAIINWKWTPGRQKHATHVDFIRLVSKFYAVRVFFINWVYTTFAY